MGVIEKELFELQDIKYRDFHSRLMPTIDKERIIGIRVPILRKYAKSLAKSHKRDDFLSELPHSYYEENNVHAFVIETIKDYDAAMSETEKFLPYIDNWATCDMFSPKVFAKNTDRLLVKVKEWLNSDLTYTVRYGIGMLMRYFLDDGFKSEYLKLVAHIKSDEYYINMMRAWYFATALSKRYDETLPYITEKRLDDWTHDMTIKKAIESNRISVETKRYLRTLKTASLRKGSC